jgi:hypothetical protein
MRAQSEAVGLAVIMALVMGGIITYAVFGAQEPERINTDDIIAENYAYVLLQSEYDTGDCTDRMSRILDRYTSGIDPCDFTNTLDDAAINGNISQAIEHFASDTLDVWGLTYEVLIYDSNKIYYEDRCPGYSRSGVGAYTLTNPDKTLEFAICS